MDTTKELPIAYTSEHLVPYEKYIQDHHYRTFLDKIKIPGSLLGALLFGASIYLDNKNIFFNFFLMALAILIFVTGKELFDYFRLKNDSKVKWKEWDQKSVQEEYHKLEYDNEKIILFAKDKTYDFPWTETTSLWYNENYLFFCDKNNKTLLLLPMLTLGEVNFHELLTVSKTKIFRCSYYQM